MQILPVKNGVLDWESILFGIFGIIMMGLLIVMMVALGKAMIETSNRGEIDRSIPCEKYTIEEYQAGKVTYECAVRAEEIQERIK